MLKRVWNGFLRQKTVDESWTAGKKKAFWGWNLGWLGLALLCVALVSLYCAPTFEQAFVFQSYFKIPWLVVLNLVPVVAFGFFLYFLLGRVVVAYGITATLVMVATFVNRLKIKFRGDPLLFEDLFYWREAGSMVGQYLQGVTFIIYVATAVVLAGGVFLALFVRGRPSGCKKLRFMGLASSLVVLLALIYPITYHHIYNVTTKNDQYFNKWSTVQVYQTKGFVYPFLHSIPDAFPTVPDGYSDDYARDLLMQYRDGDIPDDKQVSVITVMLEAYADFSGAGIEGLDDSVYENLHAIQEESYHGNLIADVFAGGTVTTERSYLTGFTELPTFRTNTNAYPWYFQSQGYTVTGLHPSYDWFYNRGTINPYLGYEDYRFIENYFYDITDWAVGMDDVFFPALVDLWEENLETGKPLFAYNISYQGHGPYETERYTWGDWYMTGNYSQESTYIMNNYFGSIYDTSGYLVDLLAYFRDSAEPVVLVLFGDHKPWFGDDNSVYQELGMEFDLSTEQGMHEYYATPYIIWANDAAKAVTGNDFVGTGPDVSPAFLMNQVFDQIGWDGTAYTQAIHATAEQVPVINVSTGNYIENGTVTDTLSPEGQSVVDDYNILRYYWSHNFAG